MTSWLRGIDLSGIMPSVSDMFAYSNHFAHEFDDFHFNMQCQEGQSAHRASLKNVERSAQRTDSTE